MRCVNNEVSASRVRIRHSSPALFVAVLLCSFPHGVPPGLVVRFAISYASYASAPRSTVETLSNWLPRAGPMMTPRPSTLCSSTPTWTLPQKVRSCSTPPHHSSRSCRPPRRTSLWRASHSRCLLCCHDGMPWVALVHVAGAVPQATAGGTAAPCPAA